MKPIIGIVPLWDDERESIWMLPGYMDLIRESGGIPVILPLRSDRDDLLQVCKMCVGFVLTGGHDVDPALYGESRSELCGVANESRDTMERWIFDYAVDQDLPLLGICRGVQLMNVFGGGSLYQDLPTEYGGVSHQMSAPYDRPWHRVCVVDNTPLATIIERSELEVNSYHHQAIREVGEAFEPMAISEDGLVEAIYMNNRRYIVGLQWHPELNFRREESSRRIADRFVECCREVCDGIEK
ncbi:MAG: gamma-glutamyl-gamma-aminobutyrate hydrolase family protein [Rikenellaceae bacterium]